MVPEEPPGPGLGGSPSRGGPERAPRTSAGGPQGLHVEAEGDGLVVALLHGLAGSARNFRPQVRALRDRYRVVVYDARGHARSAAPDDPAAYAPERLVADLGAVLDATGADRAVVGGLSMGAAVALRFALARPERVRGLVLASFPAGRRRGAEAAGSGRGRGIAARAEAFAEAIEREGLEAAGERFVWGPGSGLDPGAARLVRQGFLEHPPHGLAHTLRSFLARQPAPAELAPALAQLRIPALVIAGEGDPASLEPSREVAEALPEARFEAIPRAGHVVNLAAPKAVNALLREFLDGLPER